MDPGGFPTTLPEFQRVFPDDTACAAYLETVRWPEGFVCSACGRRDAPYRFATRSSIVLRCRGCKKNTSLTAGTVMQSSHTPLSAWFWGAYLMTTQTPGQSALQFQRQLGLNRYETAFTILHKLRAGMVRPERDRIGGEHSVEVDECFIDGETRGEGRGVHHKATVIGASRCAPAMMVTSARRSGRPRIAAALRQRSWSTQGACACKRSPTGARRRSKPSSRAILRPAPPCSATAGYNDLAQMGYDHRPLVLAGDPDKAEAHLPMIHLVFSNLKTWILGTHHGRIAPRHLQAYLNEYVFHFNRRFYPMTAFNSVLGLAARSASPTYAQLYSGKSGNIRRRARRSREMLVIFGQHGLIRCKHLAHTRQTSGLIKQNRRFGFHQRSEPADHGISSSILHVHRRCH
jgi:ISXO2-like transposase domain/Transposase zinc-ribbon domain